MKILLSPAKTFAKELILANDLPYFEHEAKHLMNALKKVPHTTIQNKMKLSDDLLIEVLFYIKSFGKTKYQAIYTYAGQAFKSFEVKTLDQDSLDYMENHLYILSGLYGILKPRDGISLYRLEMQDQTITNLYTYWKPKLKRYIHTFFQDELIINLASEEYRKALPESDHIYTIDFIEIEHEAIKRRSMTIKTMRGKFARYLITHKLTHLDQIKSIVLDDYQYDSSRSKGNTIVYVKEVH